MGKILGIAIGLLLAATAVQLFWRNEKVSPPDQQACPTASTAGADQGNNQSPSAFRHDPAGQSAHAPHSPTAQKSTPAPASAGSPPVSTASSERGDSLAFNALAGLLTPKQWEAFRTTLAQRREEAAKRKATVGENR